MALASENTQIGLRRCFTDASVHPYDAVQWERRDARIENWQTGEVVFEQIDVEVPAAWSPNATNILAQKYFRGALGADDRESSLRQVADRVVDTITRWGAESGYFLDGGESQTFNEELKFLIIDQRAAFNSPVWFNIGVDGVPNQASACFILSVEDSMDSILNWYTEEGIIFKGGSGAGVNLSRIRSSVEPLTGGGTASGPVSFMRGADASAGTIKSGGKTRRAAKMVVLDADHPDIEEFVWCKATEERKARALRDAGFDMSLDGKDIHSVQYQNANNSVRVTDDFMQAVVDDADWSLVGRTDGAVLATLKARDLLRQVATAAWECADPGIQFDTTINRWHTAPAHGRIDASNPCSEYFHVNNSACNLASINLLRYLNDDGSFDVEGFQHTVEVVFVAQEILISHADYPTEEIAETTRALRQIGLGYTNLGALLMSMGLPYDSDQGRATAASITSLLTGQAYQTSVQIAARMGPFSGFHANRDAMLNVLQMHRAAHQKIDAALAPEPLVSAGQAVWSNVNERAVSAGVRNSQATVLAPTGTISFLLDCDTTGIEPDLGLVKVKTLVGGGTMTIVNQSVPRALQNLGYSAEEVQQITAHIDRHASIVGAPLRDPGHQAIFACSMGDNTIDYTGHVAMMAAVQPFLSGGISKTVNCPESTTVEEIEQLLIRAWKTGVKSVAIYRDNCKVAQPLSTKRYAEGSSVPNEKIVYRPVREKLPRNRSSRTFEFRVADCKGFVTVGEYDDGRPGEIFVRVSKQGSTMAGIMDAFAISVSHGLQYGVPLRNFVDTFTGMRFEPAGMTDDPDVRIASSIMDYLFRKMAVLYMSFEERSALGIFTTGERTQQTLPGVDDAPTTLGVDLPADPPSIEWAGELVDRMRADAVADPSAPMCMQCGITMHRSGSCHVCPSCGSTSGCS